MQIKAVPGIRACAVLDVGRRELHPLFPAIASPQYVEDLAGRLIGMADQMQPREQVEFQFDKQVCMVRRLVRSMIFVQGKPGYDEHTLKLTLTAVSSAIDRSLRTAQSTRAMNYDFTNPEYLQAVLTAFAASSDFFKEHLGLATVTKRMQRSRDNIASLFPLLADFGVDQNGRVYVLKGRAPKLTISANEAFSRWLHAYLMSVWTNHPSRDDFDLRAATVAVAETLENSNFYGALGEL